MASPKQASTPRLPRGPHRLSREEVERHQRERIIAAVIEAVGAKGYGSTTITDITRRARVSRDTFYEQFTNKEASFLAAYDAITRELLGEMIAAGTNQPTYVEGMRDGVRAYLNFWSERPGAARLFTLEVMAAGSEALARREQSLERFAHLYRSVAERAQSEQPGLPTVPDLVSRAIVVAAVELTTQYVREGRVSALPELERDVLYLWLMVVAGHEVAASEA